MTKPLRLNTSLIFIFFFSGVAGLIYEIVWVRFLTMFVGGSAFSVSIVLTIFMGGLALGSAIAARLTDRLTTPNQLLILYGLIEIGIAVYGLLFVPIMSMLQPVYALIYNSLALHYMTYNIVSAAISMLVLIVPTTLMGATLPILSKYYLASDRHLGAKTGRLYGMNTIGGALGALLAGIVLIHHLGVLQTLLCAVAINLIIGSICLFYAKTSLNVKEIFKSLRRTPFSKPIVQSSTKSFYIILVVSGFCSMAYEVIWTKLLGLLAGPTTYSFSIVLFTFIVGLALGSMLFGYLADKVKNRITLLIVTQLAAALSVLIVSQLMGNSNLFFAKLLYENRANFFLAELYKGLSLFLFMIVPTMFLGAVFPIVIKITSEKIDHIGATVGRIYAVNTIGALLGSFSAGFILVPLLGKSLSLSMLIILQTAAAVLVFLLSTRKKMSFVYLASALLIVAGLFFPRWNPNAFIQGRYFRFSSHEDIIKNNSHMQLLFNGASIFRSEFQDPDVLYFKDGIGGFVAACQSYNALGVRDVYLSSSGKMEGSSQGDLSTTGLCAHYPLLLHPDAQDVLVIGLGTGITAGEALYYPINTLDVVEISPHVVKASAYFEAVNNNYLDDPRTTVYMQDARTHLTLSNKMYDVISSEPSNPWMAGVANLYTRDYFSKVKQHLHDDGIFLQWYHAYQSDWDIFSLVGRTITSVFPNTVLVKTKAQGGDFLFISFKNENAAFDPKIIEHNKVYANTSPHIAVEVHHVLYPFIVGEEAGSMFGDGDLHTDNHPYLEYKAPFYMYNDQPQFLDDLIKRGSLQPASLRVMQDFENVDIQIAYAHFLSSMNVFGLNNIDRHKATPIQLEKLQNIETAFYSKNIVPYYLIKDSTSLNLCLQLHERQFLEILNSSSEKMPDHVTAETWLALGRLYGMRGHFDKSQKAMQQAAQLDPFNATIQLLLSYSYEETGRFDEAIKVQEKLLQRRPRSVNLLSSLAINYAKIRNGNQIERQNVQNALHYTNRALAIEPDNQQMLSLKSQIEQFLNKNTR